MFEDEVALTPERHLVEAEDLLKFSDPQYLTDEARIELAKAHIMSAGLKFAMNIFSGKRSLVGTALSSLIK